MINRSISTMRRRSSRSRHPISRVERRLSSRARFFALSLFLGLGVGRARSARANSATHAARNVTVTATQTTTIVIAGLSLMTVGRRGAE